GVARKLDHARVRGLYEVVQQRLPSLDRGADLLPADSLGVDVGDPHRAVGCEQRRRAVVVAHHPRIGELAAQRLDLDAVSDGLQVAHRFPYLRLCSVCMAGVSPQSASSSHAERPWPWLQLSAATSSPPNCGRRGPVLPVSPGAPVPTTCVRSPAGEHGMDGKGVVHGAHAHPIPDEAEVGPVDVDLGVEPNLAVAPDRGRGIKGQRAGPAAHSQGAGHGHTATRRPDRLRGEGDVGIMGAVPMAWWKTPFTRTRPTTLLFSRMLDLRASRTHAPARAPCCSRACSAGTVIGSEGACTIRLLSFAISPSGSTISSIVFELNSISPVLMASWKRLSVASLLVAWAVDIWVLLGPI